nr:RNA-directed DNA polymerase, eukaryota [Tanacetum cinerariifolium]
MNIYIHDYNTIIGYSTMQFAIPPVNSFSISLFSDVTTLPTGEIRPSLLAMRFPKRLSLEQQVDLESEVSNEEIKRAMWDCGTDKAPGPDGFTFEFYRGVRGRRKKLVFKVDFEKAYDSVRSSRGSIILNGSPTEELQFYKGLKQGDPLSPFLFILIMESLHLSFQRVEDAGMFKGIKLGSSISISHMFYADDAVFVGHCPRGGVEQEQFKELVTLVHDVRLVLMSDRWTWTLADSGEFSVASVRQLINDKTLSEVDSKTRWIKYVPIKVNVLAWKVKYDSLPTRFNVSRRGIPVDSIKCGICDTGAETSSHLFFSCCMVRQTVCLISRWWDISYAEFESYED